MLSIIVKIMWRFIRSANSYCDSNGRSMCSVNSYFHNNGEVYM